VTRFWFWTFLWVFSITVCKAAELGGKIAPEQLEFFESKIRPILVDKCYSCHSDQAKKLKGGLRLDTREGVLKGGSSGLVLVPGDPESSPLIKAVRYVDSDLAMPPKGEKLPDEQIHMLEQWVKMGAPDPRISTTPKSLTDIHEARAKHWAFQPVQPPVFPKVKNSNWIQTPLDNFILSKLELKKIRPSGRADRRTFIRRVTYDLTGLPPTAEEVDGFIHDKNPEAYARLVERLLESPRYGERWGRHWLDVARYADTKGYLAGGEERRYPFSHTYRDYVIRAFNEDKPYDRFILEQLAADRLQLGEDKSALAALGFLTLGRRFGNNENDIIDDRIDVVSRGTQGLTVACARCHDHKFDPISTRDYYALHGVFASSEEPAEHPLLKPLGDSKEYKDYLKAVADIEKEIDAFEEKEIQIFLNEHREKVGDYLLAARDAAALKDQSKFDDLAGQHKTLAPLLRHWITFLDARKTTKDPIFLPWFELSALSDADFATSNAVILTNIMASKNSLNEVVVKKLSNKPPKSVSELAEEYTKIFKHINTEWTNAVAAALKDHKAAPTSLNDTNHEALRQVLYAQGAPGNPSKDEVRSIHAVRLSQGAAPIRNRITALSWTHPGAPQRAISMVDSTNPHDSHIAKRGNPTNPGDLAPRRFLEVLGGVEKGLFTNGSGRLDLARSIASRENPLTARVYVNRVWQNHFGQGLVGTAGDFGVRTEEPIQRELLDYLAYYFMENGWSTKKLHRLILLSSTYQEGCDILPAAAVADPENKLYSHMNRQRLDFESLRDTLLAVSGSLDLQMGGTSVDLMEEPFSKRRTVYGLIDRQNLPGLMRTFDFANPDSSNQGRFRTTVPQQALFLMNSQFILERVHDLAKIKEVTGARNIHDQISVLYRLLFQRQPTAHELDRGVKFIQSQSAGKSTLTPLEKYIQILLLSNELMFLD